VAYTSGQKLRASQLLPSGDWTDYSGTFAWTASTTNPTIGNGTIVARWSYNHAHEVTVNVKIACGSTSTKGTGNYSFSLPVAATAADAKGATGSMWINDSGSAVRPSVVIANTTTTVQAYFGSNGNQLASTTLLGTFTTTSLSFSFTYEV